MPIWSGYNYDGMSATLGVVYTYVQSGQPLITPSLFRRRFDLSITGMSWYKFCWCFSEIFMHMCTCMYTTHPLSLIPTPLLFLLSPKSDKLVLCVLSWESDTVHWEEWLKVSAKCCSLLSTTYSGNGKLCMNFGPFFNIPCITSLCLTCTCITLPKWRLTA